MADGTLGCCNICHAGFPLYRAGTRGRLTFIGATNNPNLIDPALRRLGRLDREVAVGLPNTQVLPAAACDGSSCCKATARKHACYASGIRAVQERGEILELHSRALPLGPDVDLQALAASSHGYSGADLAALCREAALHALMANIDLASPAQQPMCCDASSTRTPGDKAPLHPHKMLARRQPALQVRCELRHTC